MISLEMSFRDIYIIYMLFIGTYSNYNKQYVITVLIVIVQFIWLFIGVLFD